MMKAYFLVHTFWALCSFFRALKIDMTPRKGVSLLNLLVFKQALNRAYYIIRIYQKKNICGFFGNSSRNEETERRFVKKIVSPKYIIFNGFKKCRTCTQ